MSTYTITHIKKPDRDSKHEHITHVGNKRAGWLLTREEAIQIIESNRGKFRTESPDGETANVGVVHPDYPRKPYLRTYADGQWTDNLLSLPEY